MILGTRDSLTPGRNYGGTSLEAADGHDGNRGAKAAIDTFAALLRECGNSKHLLNGKRVHARIVATGLDRDRFLCNLLVQMYGNCGSLQDASALFEATPNRNLHSWSIMVSAYAQNGHNHEALKLFQRMDQEGIKPDKVILVGVLGACSFSELLTEGKAIHARISTTTVFELDVVVATALISMYGKCGHPSEARNVFEKMQQRNVVSWNAMLTAYAQRGQCKDCLKLYEIMDIKPNEVTFIVVLDACSALGALAEGKAIHSTVIEGGLQFDHVVCSAVLNMYAKCGSLIEARNLFNNMQQGNVVSWTSMIAAYTQQGHYKEAIDLHRRMDLEGMKAEESTLVHIVSVCFSLGDLAEGRAIHGRLSASGIQTEVASSALINMYSKCGSLDEARRVFDSMPTKNNVICWTAMLGAYAQHGHGREALKHYREMDLEGVKLDDISFLSILGACVCEGDLAEGKIIHDRIGARSSDVVLGSALINMYAKCGKVNEARTVFEGILVKNVVCWTAMIGTYAQYGHGEEALQLFEEMKKLAQVVKPNEVTFTAILNACSHAGLLEQGRHYFDSMSKVHGITPNREHYGCMIDLLGRAGRLEEAENLINSMPFPPDAVAWETLLGACKIHGDVKRGTRAAERVLQLVSKNAAPYVMWSNLYMK